MFSTIIRTAILYIAVTFGIRLMGKRQIGDMQPNELVVTLLISEIAAIPLQDTDQPILSGIVAIFMLVILEIIVSVLAMKSFFVRKLVSGKAVVIIKKGRIDQQAMRNVRMTVLDLVELLRSQDVFDISDVDYAVLEVNGELSVLLKSDAQNVKLRDMKLSSEKQGLPLPVISDGKPIEESLSILKTGTAELEKKLKKEGLGIADVFLMTLDSYGNHNIVKREERKA